MRNAERIKSIREAKEVSGIDISRAQGCADCGNRRTDQWEHLREGLSRYKNTARLADLAAPVV